MNLRPGDVVLIPVQFHQTEGRKVRPAAVALDSGDDDFVAAPITSRERTSEFDLGQLTSMLCRAYGPSHSSRERP